MTKHICTKRSWSPALRWFLMLLFATICLPWGAVSQAAPATREAPAEKTKAAPVQLHTPLALFPADTRIAVSLSNTQDWYKALQTTPLYRLWKEKEMQPLIQHMMRRFLRPYIGRSARRRRKKSRWQRAKEVFKTLTQFRIQEAIEIFRGPHALAIAKVPSGSETLELGLVLTVTQPQKAQQFVQNLLSQMPLEQSSYTYRGVQVQVLKGLENALHYALQGSHYMFATTPTFMKQIIDRSHGKGQNLLQSPTYQAFLKKMALPVGVSVYVAADRVLQDLAASMGRRRNFFVGLLGLDNWKSIGLVRGIQNQRFVSRLYLSFQKEDSLRGLNRLLALPAANTKLLQHLPKHTTMAALARIPWTQIWDDGLAAFKKMDAKGYKRFRVQLDRFERGILRTTVRDLLAAFGENAASFLYAYAGGGLFPQYTQVWQLKDSKLVQQAINQLTSLLALKLIPQTYRGITWHYVQAPYYAYRMIRQLPRQFRSLGYLFLSSQRRFCFAFVNDRLYFSLTPQTLRSFLDAQLDKDAALAQLRNKLQAQAKGSGAWVYLDTRRAVAMVYNTFLAITPIAGSFITRMFRPLRGMPLYSLPRSEVFVRHMRANVFSMRTDSADSLWNLRTGLGLEGVVGAGILGATAQRFFFQHNLLSYLRNIAAYTRLKQRSPTWEAKGQYALAHKYWSLLARRGLFQAVVLIAKKQAKHFQQLNEQRLQAMQKQLMAQYKSQAADLGVWKFHGDWTFANGILTVIPNKRSGAGLLFGAPDLSTYTLSFEVRNPTKGFFLGVHQSQLSRGVPSPPKSYRRRYGRYGSSYRRRGYRRYGRHRRYRKYRPSYRRLNASHIYFAQKRFQENRWVPIKIKVKGQQLSYWFGLKHYSRRLSRNQGRISILVPRKGQLEIRNLQLKVKRAEQATQDKPYPALRVNMTGTPNTIEKGERAYFRLSLENAGQLPARKLKIQFQLSPHIDYLSASVSPKLAKHEWHASTRTLTIETIDALEARQSLRVQIFVKGKQGGSAVAAAMLRFAGMNGEISVSSRLHVAGESFPTPKR